MKGQGWFTPWSFPVSSHHWGGLLDILQTHTVSSCPGLVFPNVASLTSIVREGGAEFCLEGVFTHCRYFRVIPSVCVCFYVIGCAYACVYVLETCVCMCVAGYSVPMPMRLHASVMYACVRKSMG